MALIFGTNEIGESVLSLSRRESHPTLSDDYSLFRNRDYDDCDESC